MLRAKADIHSGIKPELGNPGENMTYTVKTVHNWGQIDRDYRRICVCQSVTGACSVIGASANHVAPS